MAQNENTFGTRISNAETLILSITKFNNFTPLEAQDAPEEMYKLIAALKQSGLKVTEGLSKYAQAVEIRANHFDKQADSLKKILSNINAYIKALIGKNGKESETINQKIIQLRGDSPKKDKANPDDKSVSTSQQSYASITQNFVELITVLSTLSKAYAPANEYIKLEALRAKHQAIEEANKNVKIAYSNLSDARLERDKWYEDLKNRCQRIKNAVKSQYGNTSKEYAEVKGLKI
ncbi:MAG: hypothetical protein NW226_24385 [Microscillaceae bacterium]|nr:hypothetical protein [Microscillaceae bacterium]